MNNLAATFFRPCRGGAQSIAYRNVAWVLRNGFSPVDYFFCPGEGGSCPAFEAGESLAGNDSLEASSTGSSVMTWGCNSGSGLLSDVRLVRGLAMNCPWSHSCLFRASCQLRTSQCTC